MKNMFSIQYLKAEDRREQGFTLIELLVVILIIGILAAIAIPMFLNQRKSAGEAALKSDLKNAGTLLEGQGKFSGTLPAGMKTTNGVTLIPMRTSERNNKVTSSQFADGTSPGWGFHYDPSKGTVSFKHDIITNASDGYQGMNYRRTTVTSGANTYMGQNVRFNLPELGKTGDEYTVGIAIRHNYSGYRQMNIEYKDTTNSWPGGHVRKNINFTANQWQYFELSGPMTGDGTDHIVLSLFGPMATGQYMDATAAVIVKGGSADFAAALDTTGSDFCVQGFHESDAENIWRYSSLDGGLEQKKC